MTDADDTSGVLEAADAAGAPLSKLARVLMRHETPIEMGGAFGNRPWRSFVA